VERPIFQHYTSAGDSVGSDLNAPANAVISIGLVSMPDLDPPGPARLQVT
jgi:hypothetical protein